jgi:uncharacterized RDD family membrane protein YckC
MSQTDPYAPPQASLGGLTPAEQHLRDSGVLRYSGFWQRVGAVLLDFIIMSPMIGIDYLFGGTSRYFQLYMQVPIQLISLFVYIFMVVKYGGTPGKLIIGLRIVKTDGSPVTVKAALLRYGVLWAMSVTTSIMLIMAAMGMSDAEFLPLSYSERGVALAARAPNFIVFTLLTQVWMIACLIAVLANAKRRTLHDFIAGTVVVRK